MFETLIAVTVMLVFNWIKAVTMHGVLQYCVYGYWVFMYLWCYILVVLIACVLDLSLWFLVREIQFHCEPFNYHEPVSNLGFLARILWLPFLFLSNLSSFSSLDSGVRCCFFSVALLFYLPGFIWYPSNFL